MAEEMTYKRLRDLAREEKTKPGLVALQPEFYASVEAFLSSKFSEMESGRSVLEMREFENSVAVIKEISSVRQQKILFKAIRNGGRHGKADDMTREEHELYDRFCAVIEDAQGGLESMLARYQSRKAPQARERTEGAQGETTRADSSTIKKVRFIKDVPAYKGPNNETLGPFKPGEENALPTGEADWLIRGKLAEIVE
ncbi:MAG: hypothetical protein WC588_01240 [Candidatus Micrarchaeia archaeon]